MDGRPVHPAGLILTGFVIDDAARLLLFAMMSVIGRIPYLFRRVAVTEVTPGSSFFARTS